MLEVKNAPKSMLIGEDHCGNLIIRGDFGTVATYPCKKDVQLDLTEHFIEEYWAAADAWSIMQQRLSELCKRSGVVVEEDECVEKK